MAQRENPGVETLMAVLPTELSAYIVGGEVHFDLFGHSTRLRPVWVGEGFPADVRRALDRIEGTASTPIITARNMSKGAQELLSEMGVAWADKAGYAEIHVLPSLFVARLRPRPLRRSEDSTIKWSPTAETIAEYLLSRQAETGSTAWNGVDRVSHVADKTGISNGQTARVLTMFDELKYTAKVGPERGPTSSREFRDPSRLLSDWAGHYQRSSRKNRRVELHVSSREPEAWTRLVAESLDNLPWAVSKWLAADALAQYTTHIPDMSIYVADKDFDTALTLLKSHPEVTEVERGGRVNLWSAPEYVLELAKPVLHTRVVSPIRVYGDLLRAGDRGSEAAEHLREVAIGF